MSLGVLMKALNSIYFKNYLDLVHEFFPQIILLLVLFGYMDALIIIKWLTDYSGREHDAPSIITTMINIALNGGRIEGIPFIGSQSTNRAISILFFGKE
jgi:V-type H+-transporting ATPase subunit a